MPKLEYTLRDWRAAIIVKSRQIRSQHGKHRVCGYRMNSGVARFLREPKAGIPRGHPLLLLTLNIFLFDRPLLDYSGEPEGMIE